MDNVKFIRTVIVLSLLLAMMTVISLFTGSVPLDLSSISDAGSAENIIFFSLRLPRVCACLLAGFALALSGFMLQSASSNDLASGNIIGINAGAGFAVLLFLVFFPDFFHLLPFAAFAGALMACALVFIISAFTKSIGSSGSLILSGVAVNALFNALISTLSSLFPDVMSSYSSFSVGGFASVYASSLIVPSLLICAGGILCFSLSPVMNIIRLGDEITSSMGYRPFRIRIILASAAALLASSAVSFAGLLGFVGLVIPHLARFLSGGEALRSLVISALAGPLLVLSADLLARTVISPGELPAGIFLSITGVPFLIFLLVRRKRYD